MNFLQSTKNKIVVFISLFFLFGIIFLLSKNTFIETKKSNNISPTSINTQNSSEKNPSYKKGGLIPTYPPKEGSGVDLRTPLVTQSIIEIEKLYSSLPYEVTINTPSNQEVSIVIPDKTAQTNPWTLQVYVFGLDYQLAKNDPEYASAKNSFKYSVASLYKWIEEKGADPKKIMIIWGDKELIQNKSQEWLE